MKDKIESEEFYNLMLSYRNAPINNQLNVTERFEDVKKYISSLQSESKEVDRIMLRKLVDIVWNDVTESEEVPSTIHADSLIDKLLSHPPKQSKSAEEIKLNGINCVFINKDGKEISCYIPKSKLREVIEDTAYESITTPECDSSSCAVNNFCECNLVNEDANLSHLTINLKAVKSEITDEEIGKAADEYAFQVPYDGTKCFYNKDKHKSFQEGAKWMQQNK